MSFGGCNSVGPWEVVSRTPLPPSDRGGALPPGTPSMARSPHWMHVEAWLTKVRDEAIGSSVTTDGGCASGRRGSSWMSPDVERVGATASRSDAIDPADGPRSDESPVGSARTHQFAVADLTVTPFRGTKLFGDDLGGGSICVHVARDSNRYFLYSLARCPSRSSCRRQRQVVM